MARTGRPREFDRAEAVEQAMLLFWQRGYEATSLAQLREASGHISSASFYSAFGSKEALFREAVAVYGATHGLSLAPLFDRAIAPREAIERALRRSVDMQTSRDHPLGCLLCSSAVSCSPEAAGVQAFVAEIRQANHAAIRKCIVRAKRLGHLRIECNVPALSSAFNGFLVGLSVQARDGVSRPTLQAGVTTIMSLWETNAPPS